MNDLVHPEELAQALTRVSSFTNSDPCAELLAVIQERLPIEFATVWKIKRQSGHICAKARVVTGAFQPNPLLVADQYHFVCPLHGTEIGRLVETGAFDSQEFIRIDNVKRFGDDPFFGPHDLLERLNLTVCYLFPMKSLITTHATTSDREIKSEYFLALYPKAEFRAGIENQSLLKAVSNKIETTLSSQMSITLNKITEFFTSLSKKQVQFSIESILSYVSQNLLPKTFSYEDAFIFWRESRSLSYKLLPNPDLSPKFASLSGDSLNKIARKLDDFFKNSTSETPIFMLHDKDLKHCGIREFNDCTSIICVPVKNRWNAQQPLGFVLLINKICPLANRIEKTSRVLDYFDWEDRLLLNHISSMIPEEVWEFHRRGHRSDAATLHDPRFSNGYLISIRDWGIGVPIGSEELIFDRHYRAHGVEEFDPRGSGLGLAIVRTIVIDHYGAVWLESRFNPTTICIFLPEILTTRDYTKLRSWTGAVS